MDEIIKILVVISVIYSFVRKAQKKAEKEKKEKSIPKAQKVKTEKEEPKVSNWLEEVTQLERENKSSSREMDFPTKKPNLPLKQVEATNQSLETTISYEDLQSNESNLYQSLLHNDEVLEKEKKPTQHWKKWVSNKKQLVVMHEIFAPCKARQH